MILHAATERDTIGPKPDPDPRGPTRFALPAGAVDTHAHVVAPPPYVEERTFTPPVSSGADYIRMLDGVGMAYGVLVQVSVHGTDNSAMLAVLGAHPERLRGVAVIPPDLPERELARLHESGVRGLRMNTANRGGIGFEQLDRYEAIAAELGWHIQFFADVRSLPDIAPRIGRLRVPFVLDHLGHVPASEGAHSLAARLVRSLVADGGWVKLSGAFRLSSEPSFADTVEMALALVEAAPDRCLWGSDWPHVNYSGAMPKLRDLIDLLADWVSDPAQREAVLTTNAHRFYGFDV